MIVDLQTLSDAERLCLLKDAGDRLQHVPHPAIHPDRRNSQFFYEIRIKEDILQRARRLRVGKQRWLENRELERRGLRKRRPYHYAKKNLIPRGPGR